MKVIQYVISHDCRFLCQVFLPNTKKRAQKIKINATQNNSVPLELGKQHHTGEKSTDCTDQQSFSPSLDISRIMEDECMTKSQLQGFFWHFSHLPQVDGGFWNWHPPSHHGQDQVVSRKAGWLHHQKLLCFPHHDGRNRIKIQLVGLPSISVLINWDGRVSKVVLTCKTMDDLANMMEREHLGEWSSTQPQKSLTPKGYCQ